MLGLVIYGSELVLWCGVMACGGYYNLRPWIRRQMDKRESRHRRDQAVENAVYPGGNEVAHSSSTVTRAASSPSDDAEGVIDASAPGMRRRAVASGVSNDRAARLNTEQSDVVFEHDKRCHSIFIKAKTSPSSG